MDGQRQYHADLEKGMRAHIKQHATEFLMKGQSAVPDEEALAEEEKQESPTEAEAYAAQQRTRRDLDSWTLQGGVDHIVSGARSILSGVWSIASTLTDYLQDLPLTRSTVLVAVISLLVLSNIYTYLAHKPSRKAMKRYMKGKMGDDMTEAIQLLLSPRNRQEVVEYARGLSDILDQVERRATDLRHTIRTFETTSKGEMD